MGDRAAVPGAESVPVTFRRARGDDLPSIVALLRNDTLGRNREVEVGDLLAYEAAFADIDADDRHLLVVGVLEGEGGDEVVACLQATVLPCLTHGGRSRAQLECVRVADRLRGTGVGSRLLASAIEWARSQGCGVVQLTTDKRRPEALSFYESIGFEPTHEGLKLLLTEQP